MLARLITPLAMLFAVLGLAERPASLAQEEHGLRHRAQVFTRDGLSLAPDGSYLSFERVLSPREVSPGQRHLFDCGQAPVTRSTAEFVPTFTQDCPPGGRIAVSVVFPDERPGFSGIVAEAVPPIEWRRARPGEAEPRLIVIRPIGPQTGDAAGGPSALPATGAAPSKSRGGRDAVYAGVLLAGAVAAALALGAGAAFKGRRG